jgi:hypothetical protein
VNDWNVAMDIILAGAANVSPDILKTAFEQVANVRTPLTLAAFVLAVFLAILYLIFKNAGKESAQQIVKVFFILSLVAIVLGFAGYVFATGRESQGLFVGGTVSDAESKAPVQGAVVAILNARPAEEVTKDGGSFSIAYRPFKRGDVLTARAVADGYVPKTETFTVADTPTQLMFDLTRIYRTLRGQVVDATGATIAKSLIFADSGETTTANSNGEFTLSLKQPIGGNYVMIHATSSGFKEYKNAIAINQQQYLKIEMQR